MKVCNKCGVSKSLEEFRVHSTRKTYYGYCIECHRKQVREHYQKNKQYYIDKAKSWRAECRDKINELKSVPCTDCGKTFPSYVMDFDHMGIEEKICNISQMVGVKGMESILSEIAKCEIVCANCHRIRTHERQATI